MASGVFASKPTPPPVQAAARAAAGSSRSGYDQIVEVQLHKTRAQVKLVDIVSNSLLLLCGALAYMLTVALIDHWIVTLGFWTRMLALAVLVGGCAWWLYVRIRPLIVHRINPVYAALTIERAEPSLKNSLINFLLLRDDHEKVPEVVHNALGQRAATDLSHVPAENVVDYNPLIRIGYVLAALVVLGAAYKILSPKDPLQSVARVMAPWADIARATRVSIDDVRPGEAHIFQGDHIEVSAVLRGVRASDDVRVVFSTIDGQVLDQTVTMQADAAGLRHLATIPADDMGAQNSLQYKLVAGDAETRWYNVDVAPAPHVLVTKVLYEPPAYTGLAHEEAAHGDISGLEGTKVTLFARANREIASAFLEFDPVVDPQSTSTNSDARSLRIQHIDGQNLQVSFQLRLDDKRENPWHKHYTIRYTSSDGHRNTRPIVHAISVKPDLAPLAEILSPTEREKTVPQNRMVKIEARGVDLDFALSKLRLVAVSGGRDVLDVALLASPKGQPGQVIKTLEFTPSHYALAVGDVVEYWAVAEDNRTSPRSGQPEPNRTTSKPSFRLIIGPPEVERAKTPEDKPEPGDSDEPKDADSSSGGGTPEQSPMGGDTSAGGEKSPEENSPEQKQSGESGESGSPQQGSGEGESEQSQSGESGETGSEENGGQQSSEGGSAGQSGSSSSKPSDGQKGQSGEGGTESSTEGSEPSNSQSGGSKSGGNKPSNGNSDSVSQSNEPLASDGSQDGDAFEKIQEHLQQQEGGGASGSPQNNDAQQQGGDSNGSPQDTKNQQGQKTNGPQNGNPSGGAQSSGEKQEDKQLGDQQSGGESGGAQQGNKPNAGQSGGQQQGGGDPNQAQGQKPGGQEDKQEGGSPSGGEQPGKKPEQGQSGGENNSNGGAQNEKQNENAGGGQQGGQPQGGTKPEGEKSNSGGGEQPQDASGGQGQNDKSGAGKDSQGGGSPEQQAEKPQQKNGQQSSGGQQSGGQKQEEGGKSPSGSNKSSDSQGESGGDRKGGGEQGGGQGAKKPGNDSAGSSSAGEQGDGAANEPGSGESGNRGGGDQVADSPTGRSGEQTGEGSSSGQAEQGGEKPQPKRGNQQGGDSSSSGNQPGGNRPREGEQGEGEGEQISDSPGEGRGTLPTGGGKPADNHPSATPLPDIEPGSDAANLDYARKSTDLTLEYLKNQKNNPDPKLLDDLGWTKDDLAQFIERWDRMQRAAKTDDTGAAKRKLDDSLRSLGLRPRTAEVRTDDPGGTRLSNQRETGTRTRPPKEYAEQYRAFSKFITPAGE